MATRFSYDKSIREFRNAEGHRQDLVDKVNRATRSAILDHPNVSLAVKKQVLKAVKLTVTMSEKSLHIHLVAPDGQKSEFVFENEL
jgi:hypothetical protein